MHAPNIPSNNLPAVMTVPLPVSRTHIFDEDGTATGDRFTKAGIIRCHSCRRQNLSWNMQCTWCGSSIDKPMMVY